MTDEHPRLGYRPGIFSWRAREWPSKVLMIGAGVVMAVSALAISLVVLTFVVGVALVFGAYFWWKLRKLRKQMQSTPGPALSPRFEGDVIEGEVIHRSVRTE